MGRFYMTDPHDPDAPVLLDEYRGYRPGDLVEYEDPALAFGLTEPMTVAEIYDFTGMGVTCILDDGKYEINADNLQLVLRPRDCPDGGTCHHKCGEQKPCFRVQCCGPLSGVYPDDWWPAQVLAAEHNRSAEEI